MKTSTTALLTLVAILSVLSVKLYCATNEPTLPLAPPTNLRPGEVEGMPYMPLVSDIGPRFTKTNQVVKLQSTPAPKTNAPVFHVEQSGFDEASALFGAWAMARNPDVHDAKTIVEIARGLWLAQKRADALRQTNNPTK